MPILLAILAGALTAAPDPVASEPLPLVAIDPGHGGDAVGAVGVCGAREKDVALAVGLELERVLLASGEVRVLLTRRADETLSLDERVRVANEGRADLFVSIHGNAAPGEAAHGLETFVVSRKASSQRIERLAIAENGGVLDRKPSTTLARILGSLRLRASAAESQRFARLVQASLGPVAETRDRGVFEAPFFVLKYVDMAAVLVELGFLTHTTDCERLATQEFQRRAARALAAAVLAHLATTPVASLRH